MEKKITAQLIFEMLGRPASHLEETMNQFLNKIGEERGVKVLTKKINEPKKIEDTKQELFTTFSETEMEFDNLNELFRIVFSFMPSHIEILSPSGIEIKNFELNEILNELVIKLHKYDEIAKNLMIERGILAKQIEELKQDSGVVKNDKAIKKIKKNKKPKKKQKRNN